MCVEIAAWLLDCNLCTLSLNLPTPSHAILPWKRGLTDKYFLIIVCTFSREISFFFGILHWWIIVVYWNSILLLNILIIYWTFQFRTLSLFDGYGSNVSVGINLPMIFKLDWRWLKLTALSKYQLASQMIISKLVAYWI